MDLIYNQKKIPRDTWRYGFRTSAATGCGWIATYNALALMGYRAEPEDLIHYYERQLPLVHGNAGTTIPGPAVFFLQKGFDVTVSFRRGEFDRIARERDVCILFFRWRKKLRFGAHFVALQACGDRFTGYNTYKNSEGPDDYGESLDAFLKKRGYFAPVLIAIRDKRRR